MNIHVDKYEDWIRVYADDRLFHSGHCLGYLDWLELLARAGAKVTIAYSETDEAGEVIHTGPIREITAT